MGGQSETPGSQGFDDLPVRAGQVLDGKFRVEKIIGEGAMGLVVEATHLVLDERVALKFLRREALARPEIVARFAREARAAARINNDHVARVYDVGGTDDGSPFIVMELLVGQDLETVLAAKGPLEVGEAVEYVIQACEGLAAAHALGIIHRDIKPGNIFVTEQAGIRLAKLLDFGISKADLRRDFQNIDAQASETTQIMGSPHYMSPEQIRSTRDVDARADVWSLGIVLFELLTGQTPFEGTEVTGIIARVLHEEPRKIRSLRPELPAELEAIVGKCLEKDPANRYQTAAELAEALLPFAPKRARTSVDRAKAMTSRASGRAAPPDSLPPPPRPSGAARTNKDEGPTLTAATSVVLPTSSRPNQRIYGYLAIAAIVVGLAGAAYAFTARRDAASAGAASAMATAASTPAITSEPAPPAATTTAAATPAAEATADAPPPASAAPPSPPATTTTAAAAVTTKPAPRPRPPKPAKSAPAASAAPPPPPDPDTDIRRER